MSGKDQQRDVTKGLATVAMLKVNFDAGRDHIAMFEPFVLDAVAHLGADDLGADEMRAEVLNRHDLALPVNTLQTLLGRVVRDGYLSREGGRYFRTEKQLDVGDIRTAREHVEARQQRLATALREAGALKGVEFGTTEVALGAILRFLETYHVALVGARFDRVTEAEFRAPSSDADDPSDELQPEHDIVTARFLLETAAADGELAVVLQEMLEGFVLQNTLLLKDISTATRRFRDLHVFVDSGLLFGALGLRGPHAEIATLELMSLLRDTGALLNVFEPTIAEMRRILAVYEDRIGTSHGRLSLHPTELTRHVVSKRLTPSDIRTRSALLEKDLKTLGLTIRELPERVPRWTLDEAKLGAALASRPGGDNAPRVVHDVDCVAGVLIYRRGRVAASLDDAMAVFVTNSGLGVRRGCPAWRRS